MRKIIVVFLCGTVAFFILSETCPISSLAFWRLAYSDECIIDAVRPGELSSRSMYMFCRVLASPTARWSFLLMYRLGNAQGKTYALLGLRTLAAKEYPVLRDEFALSPGVVYERSGCSPWPISKKDMTRSIELSQYSESSGLRDQARLKYDEHLRSLKGRRELNNLANQPPLQTPTSGTPAAGAPVAPPSGAAGR